MTGIVSTIPGAISAFSGYMTNVAAALPALNLGTYPWGLPTAAVHNNFIALGSFENGSVHTPVENDWAALPGSFKLRSEQYSLLGTIRTAGGNGGQKAAQDRMNDAAEIINALHEQIVTDIAGSGNLSPSGSWGKLHTIHEMSGPQGTSGWVVVYSFELEVLNVQLIG